jgi:glycosyltransferase WbpL
MSALIFTFLASVGLCGAYLRLARRWQILDTPNERSSHQLPTPHGGGSALLLAFTLGLVLAGLLYEPWAEAYTVLGSVALVLMLLGIADDLLELSVRLRFTVYGLCCLVVAGALLPLPLSANGWLDALLLVAVAVAILWLVNLYNFMDGIDGIAAIQCFLACSGAALLSWGAGGDGSYALFCLLLALSHLGFLVWNWPPARLFMGDAGSVPTGFLLAGLALLGAAQGQLNPWCWVVLLAVFITDASWTLLWRMATGQEFTQAHRLHAYQRLSVRWESHLRVDLLLLVITVLWLFPLAAAVQFYPGYAFLMVILAYLPLLLGMAKLPAFA